MTRRGRRAGTLGVAALVLAAAAAGAASPDKGPAFGFEFRIAPMAGAAGQYQGEATVTDLATGKVVFAPRLQVAAGRSNVASSGGEGGSRDYLFSVSIEGEGKEARFTLEIRDGETLIASQKAAVKLR